jgi:hypothetical protein
MGCSTVSMGHKIARKFNYVSWLLGRSNTKFNGSAVGESLNMSSAPLSQPNPAEMHFEARDTKLRGSSIMYPCSRGVQVQNFMAAGSLNMSSALLSKSNPAETHFELRDAMFNCEAWDTKLRGALEEYRNQTRLSYTLEVCIPRLAIVLMILFKVLKSHKECYICWNTHTKFRGFPAIPDE